MAGTARIQGAEDADKRKREKKDYKLSRESKTVSSIPRVGTQGEVTAGNRTNARKNYGYFSDLLQAQTGHSPSYLAELMSETGINPRKKTPYFGMGAGNSSANTGYKGVKAGNTVTADYTETILPANIIDKRRNYINDTINAAQFGAEDYGKAVRAIKDEEASRIYKGFLGESVTGAQMEIYVKRTTAAIKSAKAILDDPNASNDEKRKALIDYNISQKLLSDSGVADWQEYQKLYRQRKSEAADKAIELGYHKAMRNSLSVLENPNATEDEKLKAYSDYKRLELNLAKHQVRAADKEINTIESKIQSDNKAYAYKGNIPEDDIPVYVKPDGTIPKSAVRGKTIRAIREKYGSIVYNDGVMEVVVPTVVRDPDGTVRTMSKDEAIAHYKNTGDYLGKFYTSARQTDMQTSYTRLYIKTEKTK